MRDRLWNFWQDQAGQGLVEYALIIAFVAVLLVGALTALKNDISELFSTVGDGFPS